MFYQALRAARFLAAVGMVDMSLSTAGFSRVESIAFVAPASASFAAETSIGREEILRELTMAQVDKAFLTIPFRWREKPCMKRRGRRSETAYMAEACMVRWS